MYLPHDSDELRAILEGLQSYAQVHMLAELSETLSDALMILAVEQRRLSIGKDNDDTQMQGHD
jgi:hypothetical protein